MMDREKVINCLNDIEQIMATRQEICPQEELQYWIELQEGVADALALLKEQEAVEPIPPTDESDLWRCGNCNHQLFRCTHQRYCENCGQAVKWE